MSVHASLRNPNPDTESDDKMPDSTTSSGSYRLIIEKEGKFISKPAVALGQTERPTVAQLQSYLPALGLPASGGDFALLWLADDDPEMDHPVLVASVPVTMKWADYSLDRNQGESFVDYLNKVSSMPSTSESKEEVSVDIVRYIFNRSDMSPQESMNSIVRPPHADSVEYEQLIARPGEVFMLLLYVEKHLSYHFVSRHPDISPLYEEVAVAQSEGRVSTEWFNAWWAKLEPLQMRLVANNSDRGFSGLVNDLDQEMCGNLRDNLRESGIANLRELVDIRNTIGHSTIYSGLVVDGTVMIAPHITKHTDRSNRETLTTHLDDETYSLIKTMIGDAHMFLETCARVPLKGSNSPH